jgi:CheY-like chemotaxis protein
MLWVKQENRCKLLLSGSHRLKTLLQMGQTMNGNARVLYIEDDPDSRRLVSRVLRNSGYEVFLAVDGLEGVSMAQATQPNLVLMDINLPNMDGRAVTTRLRAFPQLEKVPIVALTANNSPGSREMALAAGCTGFLTKPIDVDYFAEQVKSFLNGRQHTLAAETRYRHLEQHAQDVVTQLENKIRELEAINHRLYRLDRLKSDFITMASHELRTPLTLVSGYAQLLELQLRQENEGCFSQSEFVAQPLQVVKKLNSGIGRLSQVVEEIIGVSRIANNRLDLTLEVVQLSDIVQMVADDLVGVCARRGLRLIISGLEELPAVQGDGDI